MDKCSIELPSEFLKDVTIISSAGLRLFIVLRYYRTLSASKYPDKNFAWVYPPYDVILAESGLGSNSSIRKASIELLELGWIADIKKGTNIRDSTGAMKKISNRYCVMDDKLGEYQINRKLIAKLKKDTVEVNRLEKLETQKVEVASKETRKKTVRNMQNMFDE